VPAIARRRYTHVVGLQKSRHQGANLAIILNQQYVGRAAHGIEIARKNAKRCQIVVFRRASSAIFAKQISTDRTFFSRADAGWYRGQKWGANKPECYSSRDRFRGLLSASAAYQPPGSLGTVSFWAKPPGHLRWFLR
jgi:hypothetical protein